MVVRLSKPNQNLLGGFEHFNCIGFGHCHNSYKHNTQESEVLLHFITPIVTLENFD